MTPRPSSSKQDQSRPSTAQGIQAKIEAAQAVSCDDEARDWNFEHFSRVVNDMKPECTSVGSIMSAMIYQIEE